MAASLWREGFLHRRERGENLLLSKALFKGNRGNWFFSVFFTIGISGFSIYMAVLLQMFTDAAVYGGPSDLGRLLIYAVSFTLGFMVCSYLYHFAQNRFIEKGMRQYKNAFVEKLMERRVSDYRKTDTGVYLSAITNDMEIIRSDYLTASVLLTYNITIFVFAVGIMLYYNAVMTAVAFAASMLSILIPMIFGKYLTAAQERLSENQGRFVSFAKELLYGLSLIKSFRAEPRFLRLFDEKNGELERRKKAVKWHSDNISVLSNAISDIPLFAVYIVGIYFIFKGSITIGTIIAFVQLLNYTLGPISAISQSVPKIRASRSILDKIQKLAEGKEEEPGECLLTECKGRVEVEGLSFSYDGEKQILLGITYLFLPGRSYAVVGDSGSGKSTFLRLMMNYFPDYQGSITIDGMEVRQLSLENVYDICSMVEQEVFVFDAGIRENITLFSEVDDRTMADIVHRAGLDALVEEKGLEYRCGEGGIHLSGGERQRIAIARALLKKARLLFVDEGTAALDQKTAVEIEETILDIPEVTKIVITHRLLPKLLERYDEILVLQKGKLAEHGTFGDLMEKKGAFYTLYQSGAI